MLVYKIKHNEIGTRWAGSEADARKARVEMFDNHVTSKVLRKEITIDAVDIPTKKVDLLVWLNKNYGA